MCGIVGLYLKNPALEAELGRLFTPMLIEMSDRGPDSAGIAIYQEPVEDEDTLKLTLFHPDDDFDWEGLSAFLDDELQLSATIDDIASHAVLISDGDPDLLSQAIKGYDPDLQIMSLGRVIEIYKETGLPADVARRFDLSMMGGSHIIGHTRMATESAVTTAGSHPFSTGLDLCLVHNGSLSNHNWLRRISTASTRSVSALQMVLPSCAIRSPVSLQSSLKPKTGSPWPPNIERSQVYLALPRPRFGNRSRPRSIAGAGRQPENEPVKCRHHRSCGTPAS